MTTKFLAIATLVLAFSINSADAQTVRRAKNQHARIKQGVNNGTLTPAEAANVRNDQKEIRQEVRAAKADGTVTPDEKKDIRKDQRQASRKIARKKNNNRVRG